MSNFPVLRVDDSIEYDPLIDVQPKEAFYAHGKWWYGQQCTVWKSDDRAYGGPWDFDRFGRWLGGGAILAVPKTLRVVGVTTPGTTVTSGLDPVCHVATGQAMVASCGMHEWAGMPASANLEWKLYKASDGTVADSGVAVVTTATVGANTWGIDAQAAGSYLLCAHLQNVTRPYVLPPGYEMDEDYLYVESTVEYGWNPIEDVGRPPLDPLHPLWVLRRSLLESGQTTDPPEYTPYRISSTPQDGEWSFLKVRVGAGDGSDSWTVGANVIPNPGAALVKDTAGVLSDVAFDPMARSVTAYAQTSLGTLIGGNRATDTGPVMYLGKLNADGSVDLLGLDLNPSNGLCECAKADHSVTRILELSNGTILVLSKCSLHKYDPDADIGDALPGIPLATDGQPGGQCIIEVAGKTYHLTEYFGGDPDEEALHFYNAMLVQEGQSRVRRAGTVFHGPSSMTKWLGLPYGVTQDKNFGEDGALQRITWWTGKDWSQASGAIYEARTHNWQHMETGGDSDGSYLIVTGRNPLSVDEDGEEGTEGEGGICVVGTQYGWQEMNFPYRMRRMTKSLVNGEYIIAGPGRRVVNGAIEDKWRMLKFTGRPVKVCGFWNVTAQAFLFSQTDLVAAGFDLTKLPARLMWFEDLAAEGGGVWRASGLESAAPPFLDRYQHTASVIGYRPGSGVVMPYDPAVGYDAICFVLRTDGGVDTWIPPTPQCNHSACAKDKMPEGTTWTVYSKEIHDMPWPGLQVDDLDKDRPLEAHQAIYPILWARVDSDADQDDLTTYTKRLTFGQSKLLMDEAKEKIEVIVLTAPSCPDHEPPGIIIAP
jgi:hypothetical protein